MFSKTDARTRSVNSWAFEPLLRGLAGMREIALNRIVELRYKARQRPVAKEA
jgi:hypothetical protein